MDHGRRGGEGRGGAGGGGRCGSAVCAECKRREDGDRGRGEEGRLRFEVTRAGERARPSAALEGGRGGSRVPEERQLWDF